MSNFKVGDRVRRTGIVSAWHNIKQGGVYTVASVAYDFYSITVAEDPGTDYVARYFEKVEVDVSNLKDGDVITLAHRDGSILKDRKVSVPHGHPFIHLSGPSFPTYVARAIELGWVITEHVPSVDPEPPVGTVINVTKTVPYGRTGVFFRDERGWHPIDSKDKTYIWLQFKDDEYTVLHPKDD